MGALLEEEEAVASDIAPLARGELAAVRDLAAGSVDDASDRITRLHLQDVVSRIDEILQPDG